MTDDDSPIPDLSDSVAPLAAAVNGATRTRRSRHSWLVVSLGAQALLLAVGWAVTFGYTRSRIAEKFRDQIVDSNRRTAEAVREKLAELVPKDVHYGSNDWEAAQSLIENLKLPAGGFACIIDESGEILCHPDIRARPELRHVNLGYDLLRRGDANPPVTIMDLPVQTISSGKVLFNGVDTHYVSVAYLPAMHARLLVHQPVTGLLTAGEVATSELVLVSLCIGGIVLLSSGLLSWRLMSRHDRELESINSALESEVVARVDQAVTFRDALIFGLAKLADYRDTDTGAHLERIAEYCEILALELASSRPEIDATFIRRLRVASAMHDIGKVGIEDAVLLKAGPLTDDERIRMQRHPVMGADTLIAIRERMGHDALVEMSIVVALEHHERWDGKGYPLGVSAEQIELPARIVSLADVYDALTSKRVYKDAMTHEEARAVILKERGSQFDPMIVDAFVASDAQFAAALVRLQPAPKPTAAPPASQQHDAPSTATAPHAQQAPRSVAVL